MCGQWMNTGDLGFHAKNRNSVTNNFIKLAYGTTQVA
jgi:hypothetical protein